MSAVEDEFGCHFEAEPPTSPETPEGMGRMPWELATKFETYEQGVRDGRAAAVREVTEWARVEWARVEWARVERVFGAIPARTTLNGIPINGTIAGGRIPPGGVR